MDAKPLNVNVPKNLNVKNSDFKQNLTNNLISDSKFVYNIQKISKFRIYIFS